MARVNVIQHRPISERSGDGVEIVRQCKVPVLRGDSVDDLKARVRAREKRFVAETLAGIATDDVRLVEGAGEHGMQPAALDDRVRRG